MNADDSAVDARAEEPPPSSLYTVLWGIGLAAGCRAIQIFLEKQSMAASVGQAILVEWGSSRLGVTWTAPGAPVTTALVARRAAFGAAVGLGAAAILAGVLVASGGATFVSVESVPISVLAIGFVSAALAAWQSELLLHGILLRALDPTSTGNLGRVLACGVTSGGFALGRSDATPQTVVALALLGIVFGFLWLRDRGAWQPFAAHATFRFVTDTVFSGGFFQTRLGHDTWAGGDAGILGGTAAVIALAPLAVLALAQTARSVARTVGDRRTSP